MNVLVLILSAVVLLHATGEPVRQKGLLADLQGVKKDSQLGEVLKNQNSLNGVKDVLKKKSKYIADDSYLVKQKTLKKRKKKRSQKSFEVKANLTNDYVQAKDSQNIPKQIQEINNDVKPVEKVSVHHDAGEDVKDIGHNSLSRHPIHEHVDQGNRNEEQQNEQDNKVHVLANQNQGNDDNTQKNDNRQALNQAAQNNPPLVPAGGINQNEQAKPVPDNQANQNVGVGGNPPVVVPMPKAQVPSAQQPGGIAINNNFNNNNNNLNNINNNNNQGVVQPNIQPINVVRQPPKKEESLRIVWDWSDFLINYEQYVMPEQKVRRAPHATTGEPWPLPQFYVAKASKIYKLDKEKFRFNIIKETCDVIEKAVERYREMIIEDTIQDMYDNLQHAQGTNIDDITSKYDDEVYLKAQPITTVNVKIRRPCSKFPNDQMDESYDVFIKKTGSYIWANEVWGALRGLETFSQIIFRGTDDTLYVKDTVINDYPRFPHRGLLIDTSRHYIFKEVFYDILEGMAQNKMNVLHWHIVDDQSFPYQSKIYPDLSEKGAYHPSFVYSHDDIADIIEYARMRGIRVMPEFDTPGHTYSWGLSYPEHLTQCYQGSHPVKGYLGPLDPSKNTTYKFLKNLFSEILHVFKEQYIHLGGDEVPMTCWSSNPEVLRLLNRLDGKPEAPINLQNNDPYLYSYDIRKVLEYYEKRLTTDLKDIGRKRKNGVRFVMWQEIMNNNVQLPNDTIIQIWQGDMGDVQRAIDMGYNTLYSTCWYLDLIEYGTKWPKYYNCDPADTSLGYQIDEKKVLGGEACLWAEYIDNENLMTTLWPRASATAERLWSSKDVRDVEAAGRRLQEHRCRMLSRGLSVGQISGPDYCLRRGHRRDGERMTNCTGDRCHPFRNSVQIEKFNIHVQQRGHSMADCNQMLASGGNILSVILIIIIIVAILLSLKMSGNRIVQIKICRNKTMFIAFITLIVIYFFCYTSIWMQVQEFKGSFEKRVKSYSENKVS